MKRFIFLTLILSTVSSLAMAMSEQYIFDGQAHLSNEHTLIDSIQKGDIVLVGEEHGVYLHHQFQLEVIKQLQAKGYVVYVAIEHFSTPQQADLNSYLKGDLSEEEFLKVTKWGASKYSDCKSYTLGGGLSDFTQRAPFDCWKHQLIQAYQGGGKVIAANLPRAITNKVYKQGIGSLTPDEKKILPPNFQIGNPKYYERFQDWINAGGHGGFAKDTLDKMFVSQSLWDDTMAWQSKNVEESNPDSVTVVLAGDFHASYGGGLADRIRTRGFQGRVWEVSQGLILGGDKAAAESEALPDPQYGQRGDFISVFSSDEIPAPSAN